MKTLYLLRHAHTAPAAPPAMGDYERILTPEGIAEAERVGTHMSEIGNLPDFILSSSAARTQQTAEIVTGLIAPINGTAPRTHFDRKLYLAPADIMLEEIFNVDDHVDTLMVIGHNPAMAELAMALSRNTLADYTIDYKTGTLATFSGAFSTWQELHPSALTLKSVFIP